jgi:hypothetical protein
MRSHLVVVVHVRLEHMTKMPLAEHNNVVKALPSDRADQSFRKSVLPWGTWRCRSIADAYRAESADKDLTISPVPVTNEIAGSVFPATCFRDLICDPFRGWMRCNAKPQKSAVGRAP